MRQNQSKTYPLHPGKYWYCNCGNSAQFPFCDGTHKGSEYQPKKFKIDEAESVSLCMCGRSKSTPYCDGAHREIRADRTE